MAERERVEVPSPALLRELQEMARWFRTQARRPTVGASADPRRDMYFAPDTYVAKTPDGGIGAITSETGTGSPALFDDAECDIYRVNSRGNPELMSRRQKVYNYTETAIAANQWVLVTRDKFGAWLAVPNSASTQPIARFRLLEDLYECMTAEAALLDGADAEWCTGTADGTIEVYDSLRLRAGRLDRSGAAVLGTATATDECEPDVPDGLLAAAGTFGYAAWMTDNDRWEVIALGNGCCEEPADTCPDEIDGIKTRSIAGFDSSKIQFLSHDACGCLIWRDTVECDQGTGT